jgi:hypothetical protein
MGARVRARHACASSCVLYGEGYLMHIGAEIDGREGLLDLLQAMAAADTEVLQGTPGY